MEFSQLKCRHLLLFATVICCIWMQVESSRHTPLMTLTYATHFTRGDTRHQSQTCGRYYGMTFMRTFWTQTVDLQDVCNQRLAPNRHVNVTMVARGRVRFPDNDVQLITYLNVSVDGVDSRKDDVLACATYLNSTTVSADSADMLTIPADGDCPEVTMRPPHSGVIAMQWGCIDDLILDETTWECKDAASGLRCPRWLDGLDDSTLRTYRGKCYQFVADQRYWGDARDYCWRYEGRLVKVPDAQTSDWLINALTHDLQWTNNGVWIGLHDRNTENTFEWVTDTTTGSEAPDWTNWANGHPSSSFNRARDCVRMNRQTEWKWHDTACAAVFWKYRFICEYDLHAS